MTTQAMEREQATFVVPPGHSITVWHKSVAPVFVPTSSGVYFADFGAYGSFIEVFAAAEDLLQREPHTPILWIVQASALETWARDPAILSGWLRRLHCVRRLRGSTEICADTVIAPYEGKDPSGFAGLLRSLGLDVHYPSPQDGSVFIEVHRPDGTIVIGMTGPAAEDRGDRSLLDLNQRLDQFESQPESGGKAGLLERAQLRSVEAALCETPLSDLIERSSTEPTKENYDRFLELFRKSQVGVFVIGAPTGTVGEHRTTGNEAFALASTQDPEGNSMILAFADPTGFSRTFGRQFNAEMSGEDVLKTAQSDRACKGIRINSAKAEVSMLIFRDTIDSILGTKEASAAGKKKPGWKFW